MELDSHVDERSAKERVGVWGCCCLSCLWCLCCDTLFCWLPELPVLLGETDPELDKLLDPDIDDEVGDADSSDLKLTNPKRYCQQC